MYTVEAVVQEKHRKVFESRGLNGHESLVEEIKARAASLLAAIEDIPVAPENSEAGRLVSVAKTDLESSVMWAVKAISRG